MATHMIVAERSSRRHPQGGEDQRRWDERDRDRILHSLAFKRLGGVTQVVSPTEGHVFHNRLTHTLKVAQIGRRIAEDALRKVPGLASRLSPDVVEAACLAHDLGHPPFGHVAEKTLDILVRERGDADGYEGNAQSFRILTHLACRWPDLRGLNLARATLAATLKYPWLRDLSPEARRTKSKRYRKFGAYRTEVQDLRFALSGKEEAGNLSLEAAIMNVADDIAYSTHDLEDFYRAGLVPLEAIGALPITDERPFGVGTELDHFLARAFERNTEWSRRRRDYEAAFNGLILLSPFVRRYRDTREQRAQLREWSSSTIGRFVTVVRVDALGVHVPDKMQLEVDLLQEFIWQYVIEAPALASVQFGHRRVVEGLFNMLFDDASYQGAVGSQALPTLFQSDLPERNNEPARARLVADAISSLTDNEALSLYRRLGGYSPGSILDQTIR